MFSTKCQRESFEMRLRDRETRSNASLRSHLLERYTPNPQGKIPVEWVLRVVWSRPQIGRKQPLPLGLRQVFIIAL